MSEYSEGSHAPVIELPPRVAASLTVAIQVMGDASCLLEHQELAEVQAWLELEDHLSDVMCDGSNWQHVVDPEELAGRIVGGDVPTIPELRSLLASGLAGDTSFWGEEYPVPVAVPVARSAERTVVLGCQFTTWANEQPYTRHGLFASVGHYRAWLARDGAFVSESEFNALTPDDKCALATLRGARRIRRHLKKLRSGE